MRVVSLLCRYGKVRADANVKRANAAGRHQGGGLRLGMGVTPDLGAGEGKARPGLRTRALTRCRVLDEYRTEPPCCACCPGCRYNWGRACRVECGIDSWSLRSKRRGLRFREPPERGLPRFAWISHQGRHESDGIAGLGAGRTGALPDSRNARRTGHPGGSARGDFSNRNGGRDGRRAYSPFGHGPG